MRFAIFLMSMLVGLTSMNGVADAGKKGGITMPDTITIAGKQLTLNGMGVREATWMKVDVYVAGLYVENVSSNPNQLINANESKVLILKFVRDVGRGDITKAWSEGFKKNATVSLASLQPSIDRLNSWMPAFKDGDQLSFVYVPGEGTVVEVNNVRKGVLKGEDFARSLFSIWLGKSPPNSGLKRGLLGRHPEA